jgi:hypothetical protein
MAVTQRWGAAYRDRVAAGRGDRQAAEVVVPTLAVVADHVLGEASVDKADARLVALGVQRDLDGRRARLDRVARLLPTEGEHDLLLGHDLEVLARGLEQTHDQHAVATTGPRV